MYKSKKIRNTDAVQWVDMHDLGVKARELEEASANAGASIQQLISQLCVLQHQLAIADKQMPQFQTMTGYPLPDVRLGVIVYLNPQFKRDSMMRWRDLLDLVYMGVVGFDDLKSEPNYLGHAKVDQAELQKIWNLFKEAADVQFQIIRGAEEKCKEFDEELRTRTNGAFDPKQHESIVVWDEHGNETVGYVSKSVELEWEVEQEGDEYESGASR